MKKLLSAFLLGQMLIISLIFCKSIYNIYILNNLVDSKLEPYKMSEVTAEKLSMFYDGFLERNHNWNMQIIKMPVADSENSQVYDIYHTNVSDISKQVPVDKKDIINYRGLTKDEFTDSSGVFYTDMPIECINEIASINGINIEKTEKSIMDYKQVLQYNMVNFSVLLGITILIVYIYAFSRNKINAVKSMLGYSTHQMVKDSVVEFLKLELLILLITIFLHMLYFAFKSVIVPKYFFGLFIFSLILMAVNIFIVWTTHMTYRRINFSEILKNKICTPAWNIVLKVAKISFMVGVTLSLSIFIKDFKNFKSNKVNIDNYKGLNKYFTSDGANTDSWNKMIKNPELLVHAGDKVKSIYNMYDKQNKVIAINAPVLNYLSPEALEHKNMKPEDVLNNFKQNYAIFNCHYVNDCMKLADVQGNRIKIEKNGSKPQILVPEMYKNKEEQIKNLYIKKINDLIQYDKFFKVKNRSYELVSDVKVTYYKSGQEVDVIPEMGDDKKNKLVNTIIIVDEGSFAGSYYIENMGNCKIAFEFNDRNEFKQLLLDNKLNELFYSSTLLTPYLAKIRNYEFKMNQSLVFSALFVVTLLFILFTSNRADMMIHRKGLATRFILGDNMHRQLKFNYLISFIMLLFSMPMYILKANVLIYACILILDFVFMLYSYSSVIRNDIVNIMKGA